MPLAQHTRTTASVWDELQDDDPDRFAELEEREFNDTSSITPQSSPNAVLDPLPSLYKFMDVSFSDSEDESVGDPDFVPLLDVSSEDTDTPSGPDGRKPSMSVAQQACAVLEFMKTEFPRMSLKGFLKSVFTSKDPTLKMYSGRFLKPGPTTATVPGGPWLMQTLWERGSHLQEGMYNEEMAQWVVETAASVCSREFSHLTNNASNGRHYQDAKRLRVNAKDVSLEMVRSFKLEDLTSLYNRTLPRTQRILSALMVKDSAPPSTARNADDVRTYTTSMLLNMRSRNTNYHGAINALVFWDQQVPKRLIEAFNHIGLCSSYSYQVRSVDALSKDVRRVAAAAANNPDNLVKMPYDNFNWEAYAYETSVSHGSTQHDQVSAMVVIPTIPQALRHLTARHLASAARFDALAGSRLNMSAEQSFVDIIPTLDDYATFRLHAIHHVAEMLTRDLPTCRRFAAHITPLTDAKAIEPVKTERYYLPTFDQEQASTRGNMVVLEHYFLEVLQMPKEVFQTIKAFVLGDRLTTARDRAAQDQRSVDISPFRFDHLSCFEMLGGLMHYCLNMIQNFGRVYWGTTESTDALSLQTLRSELPNRANINTRKYDYYAWLRFLEVILRSLTVTAALSELHCGLDDISRVTDCWTPAQFSQLCESIVDKYLVPSVDALEDDGVKTRAGDTVSGHGVRLLHDLMTLREMRDAIKKGHPTRILRMLKFWAPMFYAGGGYNYSHETMEFLHNIVHDWPSDTAEVLLAALLVNTTGRKDNFVEGDLDVEHLNNAIKARAHGPNATPKLLEKITPAIGELRQLVQQLFDDLNVEGIYQRHAHVKQDEDVVKLVTYMRSKHVFLWNRDEASSHKVPDLLRDGLLKLSGRNGGHMKHLMRHKLRLRSRHELNLAVGELSDAEALLAEEAEAELDLAVDTHVQANHSSVEVDVFDIPDDELLSLDVP